MSLRLEAILFNHDSTSATVDAFNIRRNESDFIELPEWRRGVSSTAKDSPAAYACSETKEDKALTIKVNFSFDGTEERDIRARDANLHREPLNGPDLSQAEIDLFQNLNINPDGNVLGVVQATTLMLNPGETGFQPFKLESVRIWDEGVGADDIVWRWQYRVSGTENWIDFAITTHRIYTVLNEPTAPWLKDHDPSNTQLPWTQVLDYACEWARGAQDTDEAAERITIRLNELGQQRLVCYSGGSFYTDTEAFDCTSFLSLLGGGTGKGNSVNCDDCAAIVSTFANSVGCNLVQMCITSEHASFKLKPHQRIGLPGTFENRAFFHHMVAAEGCSEDVEVFDACVQIGGDPSEPTMFTLPANLALVNGKGGYLFRLVSNDDQPITHPFPDCKRRRLGPATGLDEACTPGERLAEHFGFEVWRDSKPVGTRVFVYEFFLAKYITSSLELAALQESQPEAKTKSIHSLWKSASYGGPEPFRIDIYQSDSRRGARETVLKLLASEPTLVKREFDGPGDVTFADSDFESILFATGNLVFYLRNLCSKFGSLLDVAQNLNDKILNPPPDAIEPLAEPDAVKRFSFASGEGLVDTKVKIREEPANPHAPRRLYQFLADKGEVSRGNGQLMYRPESAGNHTLNIFAADEQGNAVQQTLRLLVHD